MLYCQYKFEPMLKLRLREALDAHHARTGERITYEELAQRTGLSKATVESLATRPSYNTTLNTVDKLCAAIGCHPGDILEYQE